MTARVGVPRILSIIASKVFVAGSGCRIDWQRASAGREGERFFALQKCREIRPECDLIDGLIGMRSVGVVHL